MPSMRSYRNKGSGSEKATTKKGKSIYRASSFHGQESSSLGGEVMLRPRTVPNLISLSGTSPTARFGGTSPQVIQITNEQSSGQKKLPKLLLNVTIQRSLGPVYVVMLPDSTVGDLIATAVRLYVKESRRPILSFDDPTCFDLHYSQFSLESLNREEKLMTLGSRNFFLCPRKVSVPSSCSNEVEDTTKMTLPWLKFMDLLL